ncbi:hypothetical protein MM239_00450 [Belliella sp. DSM 111904]|uniref:Anti-sigma factor n=2 Tax=Belliella filtrata TaxID=2923435 RepID=A0ABS9UUL0_9BACT|nr:hypothetical protein [Belliella filtrata]
MKMLDKEERELELFFSELKSKDQGISTPTLPAFKAKSYKIWRWIPAGIAAALVAAIWIGTSDKKDETLAKDVIIISLIEDENQKQQLIIETTSSMDIWESPTASLLELN